MREREVVFSMVPGGSGGRLSFRDVAADPARARAAFAAAHSVWVEMVNAHNVPGRFLGRFDRRAVPDTRIFRVGFYEDGKASQCASVPWSGDKTPERLCERFAPLATNPPRLDDDSFVVDRPDFVRGLNLTFYIFPAAERLSAVGEPVFLACGDLLRFCSNAVGHLVDGYVVRSGVRLLYQFGTHDHPKPTWRDVDAQFRAVVDDILITDLPGSHP